MNTKINLTKKLADNSTRENLKPECIKNLSESIKKDIEKPYNLDTIQGIEAYFSYRYGWTLRKKID